MPEEPVNQRAACAAMPSSSTILTFVVVPATYILFERARVRLLGAPSVESVDPRAAA